MKFSLHDISGQCFNRWLALRVVRRVHHGAVWLCRCECGRESEVRADHLKGGISKQCVRCADAKRGQGRSIDEKGRYLKGAA